MPVIIQTEPQPINRLMLLGSATGAFGWWLWPTGAAPNPIGYAVAAGAMAVSATALIRAGALLVQDYRLRRNLFIAEEVTTDHGTAREADRNEIVAAGMDKPSCGNFLGLHYGEPVFAPPKTPFAPPKTPFALIEAPPGAGKTVNFVIGSILHRARLGASVVVPDPKMELAPMLGPKLAAAGYEVWYVNPTKAFADRCPDTEVNLYQPLVDAAYDDGEGRKDAPKFAADFAELHYPSQKEEKNPYFPIGSRRTIVAAILYQALVDPAHCTPTDAYRLLANPGAFKAALKTARDTLETIRRDDPLLDFLKGEAAGLLHLAKANEENFGAFLEGATQRLMPFNQAGRLGGYGRNPAASLSALRDRQVILFVMTPLSHLREFSPFLSLLNHDIIAACKTKPQGHKVHIVGEELLNYHFTNLVSDLETLRGLGVSAEFYIQSFAGLVQRYGREAAQAIESYADVKIYPGVNALDRAQFVSNMLAEATIRKQDYSAEAVAKSLTVSSRELGRRLMTANEVLTMPRDEAWAFVRGMNPMRLTMAHYGQIEPWRGWVDDNPLEGAPLRADPVFRIDYPEAAQ